MKNTDSHFKIIMEYAALGYEVTLTLLYGKEAIRMVKIYSHKAKAPVVCEQIQEHDILLKDESRFNEVLNFLYNDIQLQEETKNYYNPDI
jgi:hypothetical protein